MTRSKAAQRILRARSLVPESPVAAVRSVWLLAILWCEVGTFYWTIAGCRWPDAALVSENNEGKAIPSPDSASPTHVLLVADPQLRAPHEHPPWRRWFLLTDVSLRKRWTFALHTRPDVVIFLGDMLEGGRYAIDDDQYRESAEYFKSVFSVDSETAVHYVPGNHDIGLGPGSRENAAHVRKHYSRYFGPLNKKVSIANHTFVMLDAPGLVDEDYRRAASGKTFEDWTALPNGAIDFVNKFTGVGSEEPVVLLSHIPLFRPDTAPCGPLREKGAMRRGVGPGYQNILMRDSTSYILKYVRPAVVFTGNDHDYCEYTHSIPLLAEGPEPKIEYIREVTVKAISSGDIRQPGIHLLSLASPSTYQANRRSFADIPCFLPDERAMYMARYLPLLLLSLVVLAVSGFRRHRIGQQRPDSLGNDEKEYDLSLSSIYATPSPPVSSSAPCLSSPSFEQQSPEFGTAPASLFSTARSISATGLAPTLRAAANGPYTPGTPDFTVDGCIPNGLRSPGLLSVPPGGIVTPYGRSRIPSDSEEAELDEEEFQIPAQLARHRLASEEGPDYFHLTLDRAHRRRRLVWTWTFELGGRRRRLSIGVPFLLEHVCRTFIVALRGGPRARRGSKASRDAVLKIFLDDLVAAVWPPALLFVLIWLVLLI